VAELIKAHRTTLVFVNTRRLSERIAHQLQERLGDEAVLPHHWSLSRQLRLTAEERLKEGQLKAVVATASLELGIDIGTVDLVCQIGSPRSIAVALQRVGRSGHWVGALPEGRFFTATRDELVECAALVRAIRKGELDRLDIPESPLDILAQQSVAEVACDEYAEAELLELIRSAYPYRNLSEKEFDEVVDVLSEGIATSRGRRGAYLHRDRVNRRLRARRGARLAAITSGGAIPDNAQYAVIAEPEGAKVGRLMKTSRLRVRSAMCSCWEPRRGGFAASSRAVCASRTQRELRHQFRFGSGKPRVTPSSCRAKFPLCAKTYSRRSNKGAPPLPGTTSPTRGGC